MRDGYQKLQALGVEVYGVSLDPVAKNKQFADKHAFPFKLLSDTDKKMALAYGAIPNAKTTVAQRKSFLLDEHGRIIHVIDPVNISTHLDDVLAAFDRLQSRAKPQRAAR